MAQRNYPISTIALSLTASGTTVGSGNTQSATFVVARTLVRSGLSAGELLDTSQTWNIHYVVSAMATPYEMRLKLQRRNSGGTVQSESGYGATRNATGTYDDAIVWASGTWNAGDQLALVWEHRRPSGNGNKSGTITANGASYVDAPLSDAQAEVAWTEFQVPDFVEVDSQAEVSWAEFEVPTADAAAQVSWAELEVPEVVTADAQAEVSWAELEVPDFIELDAQGEVSFAEFEIPSLSVGGGGNRGLMGVGE